jgi:hypothetical protein
VRAVCTADAGAALYHGWIGASAPASLRAMCAAVGFSYERGGGGGRGGDVAAAALATAGTAAECADARACCVCGGGRSAGLQSPPVLRDRSLLSR